MLSFKILTTFVYSVSIDDSGFSNHSGTLILSEGHFFFFALSHHHHHVAVSLLVTLAYVNWLSASLMQ